MNIAYYLEYDTVWEKKTRFCNGNLIVVFNKSQGVEIHGWKARKSVSYIRISYTIGYLKNWCTPIAPDLIPQEIKSLVMKITHKRFASSRKLRRVVLDF